MTEATDETPVAPVPDMAKEILSWVIAAYVLLATDEDLRVIQTHPGGGQYDCLTITDAGQNAPVWMNRAGHSADIAGHVMSSFWQEAVISGPIAMAERIGRMVTLRRPDTHVPTLTALSVLNIATWLTSYRLDRWTVASAWVDTSGGDCGPDPDVVSAFPVPGSWLGQEPPRPDSDALGWVFALVSNGTPQVLVNTATGAAIDTMGAAWNRWPALTYRPDGTLGCPLASQITAYRHGDIVARVISPPGLTRRVRATYQEDYLDPVTVEPMFTVPDHYLHTIDTAYRGL